MTTRFSSVVPRLASSVYLPAGNGPNFQFSPARRREVCRPASITLETDLSDTGRIVAGSGNYTGSGLVRDAFGNAVVDTAETSGAFVARVNATYNDRARSV